MRYNMQKRHEAFMNRSKVITPNAVWTDPDASKILFAHHKPKEDARTKNILAPLRATS